MRTEQEQAFLDRLDRLAEVSKQKDIDRLQNFPAWVPRQSIARFLAAYEIYKHIVDVPGAVIECGIGGGAGLYTWAHLASILEPYHYARRVIGFSLLENEYVRREIEDLAALHDMNRPIGHVPRIETVWGDATETIPEYVRTHPGLLIGLLVLDFTVAEPTRVALEYLVPLMPRGAVVVSGGIWPGELEQLDPQMSWLRCPWSSTLIWAVKP